MSRIAGMKLRIGPRVGISHTDISPGGQRAQEGRAGFGSGGTFETLISGK
jgi:hypothetical protein